MFCAKTCGKIFLYKEGNTMEEKINEQKLSVKDEELEQATGGEMITPVERDTAIRWDSKGNPTHWKPIYSNQHRDGFHYVCPHCGRLLHQGTLKRLYCDPCDEGWFPFSLPKSCLHDGIYPGC